MRIVHVQIGTRAYPIFIGPGAMAHLADFARSPRGTARLAIIADADVAKLHLGRLMEHLPPGAVVVEFPPGEGSKSLATAGQIFDRLAAERIERGDLVVAFGGGVAGDLGGFVAATWHRGVRFVQVPTTVEAAVDASVGGKTGVNHAAGKNLIGAFHQPAAVIIDTAFLDTLPERDFRAGLAESVKHAAIADPALLDWHDEHLEAVLKREPTAVSELLARNCEIKAAVVGRDEREEGERIHLNYGHTIAHAIEHLMAYELRHGECVGLGMLAENEIACLRDELDRPTADRIRALIRRIGLPERLARPLDADRIVAACRLDKKVRGGSVQFVLLHQPGEPFVAADVSDETLRRAVEVIQPSA